MCASSENQAKGSPESSKKTPLLWKVALAVLPEKRTEGVVGGHLNYLDGPPPDWGVVQFLMGQQGFVSEVLAEPPRGICKPGPTFPKTNELIKSGFSPGF